MNTNCPEPRTVPGRVSFGFEVRSRSPDTLEAFYELMKAECKGVVARITLKTRLPQPQRVLSR